MSEISDVFKNDKKTVHRIGIDLITAIEEAENYEDENLVMLLLELAQCRLKAKGYVLGDGGHVSSMKDQFEIIK